MPVRTSFSELITVETFEPFSKGDGMAGFPIEVATRIRTLPPYLFAAIDKMKQEAIARGVDIINLGIGDPDLPTPAPIIQSLA